MTRLARLKALFTGRAQPAGATYRCLTCGDTFAEQPQVCPSCGSYDLRNTDWLDGPDDGATGEDV